MLDLSRLFLFIVALACGEPLSPTQPTDTPVLEANAPDAAGEPSGFTRLTRAEPSSIPPAPSSTNTSGWWSSPYPSSKLTSVSTSAPSGDGRAWQFLMPKGMRSGQSPALFGVQNWSGRSRIYSRFYFKMEGSDYENEAVITKLAFWGYAGGAARNEGILTLEGLGYRAVRSCFKMGYRQQNVVTRNRLTSASLCAGRWYKIEVLQEINSIGSSNGKLTIWLDGVQVGYWNTVVYQTSSRPGKFTSFKVDPVWGGYTCARRDASGKCIEYVTRSRDDRIRYDGVYVSGA